MSILREELITNHLLLDYFDMWDEFDIQKVEDPKTIRYYNLIENHINNQIDASIRWLESDQARDYFFGEAKYQKEVFSALEDEWDEILSAKYPSVEALLDEVYQRGKAKGYSDMRERIRFTESDKLAIGIARNYNYHLIRKIDNDTRNQIKSKITEAVVTGEHPSSVAPKILNVAEEKLHGTNFTPKQRATMIARTEISRVQNTGILQSYVNEGYTEVKILTAGDSRVCNLCLRYAFEYEEDTEISYDNRGEEKTHNILQLVKGGEFPPFHPLCRCTYLSVWHSKGEPPENPPIIDLTYVGNWEYEHDGTRYNFQGNTPPGRDKFLRKYGVDVDELNKNPKHKSFLVAYTDEGDGPLNDFLRGDISLKKARERWKDVIDDLLERKEIIEGLSFDEALNIYDEIFEKYSKTLEEDIIICRREKKRHMGPEGESYYDNEGFTSTSIYEYVEIYGDEINYILIPKGTKILYLEELTMVPEDYEILFPPRVHLSHIEDLDPHRKVWKL